MSKSIRVGIIGLSASGGWASAAHLPYLRRSAKYTITAVANSSLERSEVAIAAHGLGDGVKACASPKELADSPEVDLVVCCVGAVHHYEALRQAVGLGKDMYCEWPLGLTLDESEQLCKTARENGSRTMIGLQSHCAPAVVKIREIISQGNIGRVLSSTTMGPAVFSDSADEAGTRHKYPVRGGFSDNFVALFFSHAIDVVLSTLGELKSYDSMLDIRKPEDPVKSSTDGPESESDTSQTHAPSSKEAEDRESGSDPEASNKPTTQAQIMFQAYFESGGVMSYHMHGGRTLPPGDGLQWRISGEKGELLVSAPDSTLQSTASSKVKIQLFRRATGEMEDVVLPTDEWDELPTPAQNIARLYEAYADGKTERYPDWGHALKRHTMIENIGTSSCHTVFLCIDAGKGRSKDFQLLPTPVESFTDFVRPSK
jgi:predicted dehydrogenase